MVGGRDSCPRSLEEPQDCDHDGLETLRNIRPWSDVDGFS